MSEGLNGAGENQTDQGKKAILIRVPEEKILAFKELYPWHGGLTQFWLQCLDEFLHLAEGSKTPAQLTSEAVSNVFREGY